MTSAPSSLQTSTPGERHPAPSLRAPPPPPSSSPFLSAQGGPPVFPEGPFPSKSSKPPHLPLGSRVWPAPLTRALGDTDVNA